MRIKVISVNIWHGGFLFDDVVDFLQEQKADIVLMQEVYNSADVALPDRFRTMEVLSAKLGYKYSDFVEAFLHDVPEGKLPHGNGILSRFTITDKSSTYLIEPDGREAYADAPEVWPILPSNLQHVVLDTPVGSLNVYNLHGVWDLDGDNFSPRRQRMSQIIINEVSDKTNVILGGDSNAKVSNPAMRNIEKHLANTFKPDLQSTFNMRRKDNPGYATAAVDVMYVSPYIKVLSAECPDVDISDHLPLVVSLEID